MDHHLARDASPGTFGDGDQRDPVLHLVLEQFHVAADRDAHPGNADSAARARAFPVVPGGFDRCALCLLHHGACARRLAVPDGAEGIRARAVGRSDQGMKALRLLRNRFVWVPLVLFIAIAGWNAWVATHDHGIISGRVVDAHGKPVAGATVHLWVFNFTTFVEKDATTTAADGSFHFTGNPSHNIQLSADK